MYCQFALSLSVNASAAANGGLAVHGHGGRDGSASNIDGSAHLLRVEGIEIIASLILAA